MANADSFRINIAIASMHRLTVRVIDVSNEFKNKNVPIHERVCVSPLPYDLDWFERSYPSVTLNQDDGPFFIQYINNIQVTKPTRRQCNRLIDAVVIMIKYKKITIDHDIYIRVFNDVTVSYLTVSTDDVINTTNNDNEFPELTIFLNNTLI